MSARGLPTHGFIGAASLHRYVSRVEPRLRDAWGLDAMRGALVAALPYDPAKPAAMPGSQYGIIGAFAAAHHYAALARLLKAAAADISKSGAYARSDFRVAVNSPLPEKSLAVLAGLAFIGRSSLAISDAYGPACVLGALFLPFDPLDIDAKAAADDRSAAFAPGALCGACRACVDACPVGAIAGPGASEPGMARARCIQHWASDAESWRLPEELPPAVAAAWGSRLYGCDECVRACPYLAGSFEPLHGKASPAASAAALLLAKEARPGPCVDLNLLIAADEDALKRWKAGSALGFGWFGAHAIRRNARMALLSYLEPFGI